MEAQRGLKSRANDNFSPDHVARFKEAGYAVVRSVFTRTEIDALAEAIDRVYGQAIARPDDAGHPNVRYRIVEDPHLGRICRIAQWPAYVESTLARTRIDARMLAILAPLIGDTLKQITSQLHWKPAGAERVEFGFHQDIRFRRPRSAFRDPGTNFIQTAIAVDPHNAESGGIRVFPNSHKMGDLCLGDEGPILDRSLTESDLAALGLDPAQLVDLELEPGDVALWGPFMVHGSGLNTTSHNRRVYINGYVAADACDLGEWAFQHGRPCPLEETAPLK